MRGRKPLPSNIIDIRGGSKFTHRPPRSGEPKPPALIPKMSEASGRRGPEGMEAYGEGTRTPGAFLTGFGTRLSFASHCKPGQPG